MHPEMSLVLLTVLAGAGQGIFILLVALDAFFYSTGMISSGYIFTSCIASITLQAAGIVASTLHLGNPQRGWRAIIKLKNSWLSREVMTLSLASGSVVLYLAVFYLDLPGTFRLAAGITGVAAGLGFFIASSMVYASVRFIKEWSNSFTPSNFVLMGLTSGLGAGFSIMQFTNVDMSLTSAVVSILIVLGVVSLILKALSYKFNSAAYVSVNIKNAVGINDPNIKLMDMGTSYSHYNTKEFYYPDSGKRSCTEKALVLVIGFVVPLLLWVLIASGVTNVLNAGLSLFAALSMIAGLIMERRLFFIQGNNLQNLYYSNFRSTGAKNPLVSKARKGKSVPIK